MTLKEASDFCYNISKFPSKEEITFYPPGIPIICPGERFTADILAAVKNMASNGLKVTGPEDTGLKRISVIRMEKL